MLSRKAIEILAQVQKDETQGGHFTGTVAIEELIKSQALPEVQGTKVLKVFSSLKPELIGMPIPKVRFCTLWPVKGCCRNATDLKLSLRQEI